MSDRLISRMLAPLRRGLQNIAMRGVITLVNSATKMQAVQVSLRDGELKDNLEHIEPYGFTSHAQVGAEAVTLFFNGDRSHGIAIVVGDRRYRLTGLEAGEVALHDDQGQKVHFKRDKILIETPLDFELRAKNIKLHASESYQFDVNGQGQKWDGLGVETWQDDDVVKPHHNHAPPEIP